MSIGKNSMKTPIYKLTHLNLENEMFIMRDDLYPLSFGGNKARKAELFWKDACVKHADCLVTYGSSSSNHCRVIANLAAMHGLPCYLISPEETCKETFNRDMMVLFGAKIIMIPVSQVSDTIDATLIELQQKGLHPYFIMGGGHGNIGTQAYVNAYQEIEEFEQQAGVKFDYIFHASGTGTTQAGLVCGQILSGRTDLHIIGISIARKKPYGRDVVLQSVKDYLDSLGKKDLFMDTPIEFVDNYTGDGYGFGNDKVHFYIQEMLLKEGVPLDVTYTGKAFAGMSDFLANNQIKGKRILFLHTGGTPLFFDYLSQERREKG